jgi:hypothetical protein
MPSALCRLSANDRACEDKDQEPEAMSAASDQLLVHGPNVFLIILVARFLSKPRRCFANHIRLPEAGQCQTKGANVSTGFMVGCGRLASTSTLADAISITLARGNRPCE